MRQGIAGHLSLGYAEAKLIGLVCCFKKAKKWHTRNAVGYRIVYYRTIIIVLFYKTGCVRS